MHKIFSIYVTVCVLASLQNAGIAEVINAGVGGNRSSQLLKRLNRNVLAHHPTVVVLMVGTNDRLNSSRFIKAKVYQQNVNALIDRIEASGAKVLLITPPPCIPELLFSRHDPEKYRPVAGSADARSTLHSAQHIPKAKAPLARFSSVSHTKQDRGSTENQRQSQCCQ